MTKEEFIQMRSKYRTDLECCKCEKIPKMKFYKMKVDFGLGKHTQTAKERKQILAKLSPEEFMKIRNLYSNDLECAKALNLDKDSYYKIKATIGLTKKYDFSEINFLEFKKLYDKKLTDIEISKILKVSVSKLRSFRVKHGLENNVTKHFSFTEEQYQIFIGGMLGDSALCKAKDGPNNYFCFAHSLKQENYALWKYSMFSEMCFRPYYNSKFDKRINKTLNEVRIVSYRNELFTSFYDKFYKKIDNKTIKYINKDILYSLSPLGIAVWYMDDGMFHLGTSRFSTNCFSIEDLQLIQQFFMEKYNIEMTIQKDRTLYIRKKSQTIFENLVRPYITQDLQYKLSH